MQIADTEMNPQKVPQKIEKGYEKKALNIC